MCLHRNSLFFINANIYRVILLEVKGGCFLELQQLTHYMLTIFRLFAIIQKKKNNNILNKLFTLQMKMKIAPTFTSSDYPSTTCPIY